MKGQLIRGIIPALFAGIVSCSYSPKYLSYDPSSISAIRIGSGLRFEDDNGMIRDERKIHAILENAEEIQSFLRSYSFGNEHPYTVKHRLPAYVELYSGDSLVGHVEFEHRVMRYEGKEYYLSRETAAKLTEFLRGDTQPEPAADAPRR